MEPAQLAPLHPVDETDLRRRRGRSTRARILAGAARLFAERGFDATSVQAIAAASGITPGAIYRHFTTKADLLLAVAGEALESTFRETIAHLEPSAPNRIADMVLAYVRPDREFTRKLVLELTHAASRHPDLANSLQTFHLRARDHIALVIEAGQRDGELSADIDATRAARDVLLLIMGICHIDDLDPDALADVDWQRALRRTIHAAVGGGDSESPRQ